VNRESDSGISRASEAGRTGDVDGLLELVNGTDYWGRIAATRLLGERREQRAVPLLRRNVHARDEGLRRASVKALGAIDADPESAQLIFDCGRSDDDFWVRCTAAEVLVARSDPRAVVIFANLLDDATTEPKPSFRHFRKIRAATDRGPGWRRCAPRSRESGGASLLHGALALPSSRETAVESREPPVGLRQRVVKFVVTSMRLRSPIPSLNPYTQRRTMRGGGKRVAFWRVLSCALLAIGHQL
jgi:hypothetical protein